MWDLRDHFDENICMFQPHAEVHVLQCLIVSPRGCCNAGKQRGIVLLRVSTLEGMELLAIKAVNPNVIYVDANHHYDALTKIQ